MWFLAFAFSCNSDQQLQEQAPPDTEVVPDDTTPPSEYVYSPEEEEEALLSVGEVEEGLREVFAVVTLVDPEDITSLYDAFRLEHGDEGCPYYYYDTDGDSYYGYDYWFDTCTTDAGAEFAGYAYSYNDEPYISGDYIYDGRGYLLSYGSVMDRLGNGLEISGSFYHYSYGYTWSNDRYGSAYLYGDARWSGDEETGWLTEELSLALDYSWSTHPDTGGFSLGVVGSLSGVSGIVNAALFDDFFLQSASAGSDCEIEPSGTISVRDDAGEWYHADFQGPAWSGAPVFPPDCDGCGQVYYRGEYLGDVCPDLSDLNGWEERPWY